MNGKKRKRKKRNAADIIFDKNMSPQEQVRHVVRSHTSLNAEQRAQVIRELEQRGGTQPPRDPGGAFAAGVQGASAFEVHPGDAHALERQKLAEDAARHNLQVPLAMAGNDISRFASAEEAKRRREAEQRKRAKPSKAEAERERRYQRRMREAGVLGAGHVVEPGGGTFG